MTIQRKTVAQFESEISQGIADRDATVDTTIGPIKDLQISPVAEPMKLMHDNVSYLSQLQSLKYADQVNPDDLDDISYNEGVVRWDGSPALGTVTFSRKKAPDSDIFIPTNFPLGTPLNPVTGKSTMFRTIESRVMYGPLTTPSSTYYNPTTGRYEIEVAVASVTTGTDTLVGPGTITQFMRNFPAFDYVTNKQSTTSAKDRETNSELAQRYLLQIRGSQVSTPTGLDVFCRDSFANISDVYVVYGNDPNLTRSESDVGAIDVWLKGEAAVASTYNTLFPGKGQLIVLPYQPLYDVISVVSGTTSYVEGTDYEVVSGEGEYAYSIRGSDGIRFLTTGAFPEIGASVIISYRYNAMPNLISATYTQVENYAMGSDVLFRWAQPVPIVVEGTLKVKTGNPQQVLALVRDRILTYVNGLLLGDVVEGFDISAEVAKVYGVDNWTYTKLALYGDTGVGDIPIGPNEYPTLAVADLIINLVS